MKLLDDALRPPFRRICQRLRGIVELWSVRTSTKDSLRVLFLTSGSPCGVQGPLINRIFTRSFESVKTRGQKYLPFVRCLAGPLITLVVIGKNR